MQIPLPLPVIVRKRRTGMNKEERRQFHIMFPVTWGCICSREVALKFPCLFTDSLVSGSPCPHHLVCPTAVTNAAVRLKPQTNTPSAAMSRFCFSLFLLQAVRAGQMVQRYPPAFKSRGTRLAKTCLYCSQSPGSFSFREGIRWATVPAGIKGQHRLNTN